MKKLITRVLGASMLSILLIAGLGQKANAQDVTVSYQTFYDNLSPYGQWVNDPEYGNVWVPNEDGDFRPYGSRGNWVMTDYGNTWVSDDPWGWACYHYGRWTYNPYYGWVWIPGYEWAPAWVSWRYGGGYSGWAPLGPGVSIGVGYNCPDNWWIFVEPRYMYHHNCYSYWRGPSYNTTYIHQTTIINNYYVDNSTHVRYNYGPRAEVIQHDTHTPVQVYRVSQLNRPGAPSVTRNTVSLYRPAINRGTVAQARPASVVQAPRSIGRPQAAPNTISGNRQPAFRQEAPRMAPNPGNTGVVGPRNGQRPENQVPQRGNPQQGPQRGNPQQAPQQPRNEPQQPRMEPRPQQPRNEPQQPRMEPRPQQPQQPRMEPRPQQPQQPRMEPQQPRMEPRPQQPQQPRMEPQQPRYEPQQPRMEPRPQPAPQQPRMEPRPQPAPQQPRPQPAPQQPRPQGEEHQGGRR